VYSNSVKVQTYNSNFKVMVLGGSGFLGVNFVRYFSEQLSVTATYSNSNLNSLPDADWVKFEAKNLNELHHILQKFNPNLLINCIALANVDACEMDPVKAEFLNTFFPGEVSRICWKLGIKFVHISTDHQESINGQLRTESDQSNFVNKYGETKILGDEAVISNNTNSIVVRTNFFGWNSLHRNSFLDSILKKLIQGQDFQAFDDIYFTPVSIYELFRNILHLNNCDFKGLINISSSNVLTKYDFAKTVISFTNFDPNKIIKSSIADFTLPTKRPGNMSLDNSLLKSVTGNEIPSVQDMIEWIMQDVGNPLGKKEKNV
jgi:dTDP-4-dehydrorhamnose reductase